MRRLWPFAVLALFVAAGLAWLAQRPAPPPESHGLNVGEVLGGGSDAGFARAFDVRAFRFPQDYGPHPRYRDEWWYFTGNLFADGTESITAASMPHGPRLHPGVEARAAVQGCTVCGFTGDGRRFGYELSLFRIALTPREPKRASHWATNQVYVGHFALTDAEGRRFHFFERFSRGALGLAGAQASPFGVWLDDWGVHADPHRSDVWRLAAGSGDVALALDLTPAKPVALEGDRGLSRKSAEPGNASYYFSIPRLATEGTITLAGHAFRVRGLSWFDREWSTSALARDEVGWDWFALQLSDGWDLMFYQLRRADGSRDPFSAGTLVDPAGRTIPLHAKDVTLDVLDRWRSPRGGTYPVRWRLTVPSAGIALEVTPVLPDQELAVSVRYWEGAVDVTGTHAGRAVRGFGYTELTGYAATASGRPMH